MCLKYKDKGHSKMHPGVPEYILYIYIFFFSGVGDKVLEQQHPKKF